MSRKNYCYDTYVGNTGMWDQLVTKYNLSNKQKKQFERFCTMILHANKEFNITAITEPKQIIAHHFEDSLVLSKFVDFTTLRGIADVGTGGGMPGIPLKILYPDLFVVLIEVSHKKREYLRSVIEELGLEGIEVCAWDWRNFLRKTEYPIDLFCARASLRPEELVRAFRPACFYNKATIVYWGSRTWEPIKRIEPFVVDEKEYKIKYRKRKFVFLKKPN